MDIHLTKNRIYSGANERPSLYDVYSPQKGGCFPLVFFAHGFKGFKDWGHWPAIMERIAQRGIHVISFNFSHNGGTVQQPIDFPDLAAFSENTYRKELEDLKQLTNLLFDEKIIDLKKIDFSRVACIGHSRGGGTALLHVGQDQRIKKLITWAAVADFQSRLPGEAELMEWKNRGVRLIKNGRTKQDMPMKYEFVTDFFKHKEELDIQKALKSRKIPHLIVHGSLDQTVAFEQAQQLNHWNSNAELFCMESANHVFGGSHPFAGGLHAQAKILADKSADFLLA